MQTGRTPFAFSGQPTVRSPARRRYLTVLFSDLCDSTRIAGAMEAEDYAEFLGSLRDMFAEVVDHHGGEIVRIDGDGVTVIFGYPAAHEDDGRRATEAAIDLHEGARRLDQKIGGIDTGIKLHTGVHAGLVLVEEGDIVRGRFEMLGDATNIAARLSDQAGPDEIVVSEATLSAERHFFTTSERRMVDVRGKDRPLAVFSILGRAPVENRFETRMRRGLAPFVGREAELEKLHRSLQAAVTGGNRLVALVGTAGIGKTRLAGEFLARAAADGLQVHRGYCESYLGARPLQPFLQLLRSILQLHPGAGVEDAGNLVDTAVARIAPGLTGRLAELRGLLSLGEHAGEGAGRLDTTTAASTLRALFEHLALAGPVVAFIDDWQWADDASRQVLEAVRAIDDRRLLFLLATREYDVVEAQMSGADVINLSPMTRPEAEATIGHMLPLPEPFMITRIADYCGGNPLFLEELCHAYNAGDHRLDGGGAWLDLMIESRFARLPEDQANLVKAASVIGHMIPAWLFHEITGAAEDAPALVELERQDFIYPGETVGILRFKHGITRDAIYHIVGLRERRVLHLKVVEALRSRVSNVGGEDNLEALAYHCEAGGARADAARYAELAGDKALAVSALDRAQTQYRAALAALQTLEQTDETIARQVGIVRKFGLASVVDPSREQLPVFQRAAADATARGDTAAVAWSEFWLGFIYYGLGECRRSIVHLELALKAAVVTGDEKLVVQVRATLGQAHGIACEYAPALALLDEAIDIKRRHRSGARQSIGLAYSLSCKAMVLADQGHFDPAYNAFDEAIALLGGAPHEMAASVLTHRSGACLWHGRMEDAAHYAREGGRIAERIKARYLFSMARAITGYVEWTTTRSLDGLQTLIDATAWLEASDSEQFLSLNFGWLTEAMVATGRIVEARRYAARAFLRARQGDRLGEAMAARALARAAAAGHGRRSASRYLDLAEVSAKARGSTHEFAKNRLCAAEVALRAGDPAAARRLIEQAGNDLAVMNTPWFKEQAVALLASSSA